jgi:hypothetical protein
MGRMADAVSSPPLSISPLRNGAMWFLLCVGLPSLVALGDYAILKQGIRAQATTPEICLQFLWYVVQVGVISYVVGRGVDQPVLRWVVFAWVLLLIDLITATMAAGAAPRFGVVASPPPHLPPAALFAGQIGLCIVWAFFGDGRWPWRLPAMVFLAVGIFWLWSVIVHASSYTARMWTELLVLQVMTLAALCGLLRLSRFHLKRIEPATASVAAANSQQLHLQFNIKHVLIWTTALAMLLGIARGLDLLTWESAQQLARVGLLWKLTIAAASAMVIIVALWVALGQGYAAVRYLVGGIFAVAVGSGLAVWGLSNAGAITPPAGRPWQRINWELKAWYEVGWWWLGWVFLSGGLLAGTLLILRTLDYRLVRAPRR